MFAVPGWSVSAASLKAEGGVKNANDGGPDKAAGASNKRKRPAAPPANNVNAGNVATLWERVIEGKSGKKPKLDGDSEAKKPRIRKKKNAAGKQDDASAAGEGEVVEAEEESSAKTETGKKQQESQPKAKPTPAPEPEAASNEAAKESRKDKKKKNKKAKGDQAEAQKEQPVPTETKKEPIKETSTAPPPPPAPKLTPLQASMREKLISARFRHLNETLYTRPSAEAFDLFQESPEMFQEYHEGFRRQVNVWPENPVDGYIKDIKIRGKLRPGAGAKDKAGPAPLLRTNGTCTVADLGCGDAKLAESLQADKKRLKLEVLSYDLQSPSPLVTRADIANLPLEDGAVNVVIFCLALMGTNWPAFVDEAYRVLHWKGELWIAEIKSRFTVPSAAGKKGKPVVHSVGNRKKLAAAGKKGSGKDSAQEEAAVEEALAVEVDGAEARKQETDVSAFVEALRKRGFLLQTQDSVDLSNKMFVKMHFVKAAPAVVGKNAEEVKEAPARVGARKGAPKFIDAAKTNSVDESSILKPCVYKLR